MEVDSGCNDDDDGGKVGNFGFEVRRDWLEPHEDFIELEYQFEGEEECVMGYVNDAEENVEDEDDEEEEAEDDDDDDEDFVVDEDDEDDDDE